MVSPSDPTPPPMPPRPGSGPETEINPQMENVLRNLNVNLEDELTRYRRQRHGRVPPPPPPRRAAQRQTIDLISVSANDTAAEKPQQPPTPPPPPPNPFLKHKASEPEESAELPDTELPSDAIEPDAPEMETPAESDSPALPIHSSEAPTEGYLESSEELLRSIEEEEEQPEPGSAPEPYSPERKSNSLLKLAGLVLVLLGGIGVGFAITNPAQFESLRSRVLPGTDVEPAETADSDLPEVPETPNQPATTADPSETASDYSPLGPDLSTREFQELDTIDDLVTLDVDGAGNATGTPSALPTPAQTPQPNPAQTPLPAPTDTPASPSAANSPTPATTSPAAAPPANSAPTNPATVTSPAPVATGSNFYVIASYTGDASLNKARELVPDAFVRDFDAGARIQLAAFDNQAQAEEQVAFLTEQGITVELFGPTNE
ncbi:MAG: hypothetical protein ACFB14_25725 [Leptolyngbyaceae cyanobacterium]